MKAEPLAVSCEHKIWYFFVPLYSAQLSLSQHSWTAVDVALNVLIAMRQCLGRFYVFAVPLSFNMFASIHIIFHTRIPYKTIIRIEEKHMKIRVFVSVLSVC